jgi:hypothetical protein
MNGKERNNQSNIGFKIKIMKAYLLYIHKKVIV